MDRVIFKDASLKETRFQGTDLRGADMGGLTLADAAVLKGATITREQASQILKQFGLDVR